MTMQDPREDLAEEVAREAAMRMHDKMIFLATSLVESKDEHGEPPEKVAGLVEAIEAIDPIDRIGLFAAFATAGAEAVDEALEFVGVDGE